jgi:ecotin
MRHSLSLALVALSLSLVAAEEAKAPTLGGIEAPAKDVAMFPAAKPGFKQVVIRLPEIKGEATVEIVARKTAMVDAVNRHSFGGKMKECNLDGWGYNYFEMEVSPHCMSTRMAGSPEDMQPRPVAVPVHGEGFSGLRYNHRLPLVIYVPTDVEVSYRVWTPGAEIKP